MVPEDWNTDSTLQKAGPVTNSIYAKLFYLLLPFSNYW